MFVNLSNHPLATWSEAQRDAALALGHGAPCDLVPPMPVVRAEADETEVAALAEGIAARALDAGARGAFVAGDYSLSYALVRALLARGVRCYAATSARDVVVTADANGASVKTVVFRFVRWRAYEGG